MGIETALAWQPELHGIDYLRMGDVAGFATWHRATMRGPAGAAFRQGHIVEEIASRLTSGNYRRALILVRIPQVRLGGRSMWEAEETHEGMLKVEEMIGQIEAGVYV